MSDIFDEIFMKIPANLKLTKRQRNGLDKLDLYNRRAILKALMKQQEIGDNKKVSHYGDATARELDNYMQNYTMPIGTTNTGLVAPVNDMFRNYNTMTKMKLKESDPFFHCKANYEATQRGGIYGAIVANIMDIGKETKDIFIKRYPISDSFRDYRANLRGQKGA